MKIMYMFWAAVFCLFFSGCSIINRHHYYQEHSWGAIGDEIILIGSDSYCKKKNPIGEILIGGTSNYTVLSEEMIEVRYSIKQHDEQVLLPISVKNLFTSEQGSFGSKMYLVNSQNEIYFYKSGKCHIYELLTLKEKYVVPITNHLFIGGTFFYYENNKKLFVYDISSMSEERLSQKTYDFLSGESNISNRLFTTSKKNIFGKKEDDRGHKIYTFIDINSIEIVKTISFSDHEDFIDLYIDNEGKIVFFVEDLWNKRINIYDNYGKIIKSFDYSKYDFNVPGKIIDSENHRVLLKDLAPLFYEKPGNGRVLVWDYKKDNVRLLTLQPWR